MFTDSSDVDVIADVFIVLSQRLMAARTATTCSSEANASLRSVKDTERSYRSHETIAQCKQSEIDYITPAASTESYKRCVHHHRITSHNCWQKIVAVQFVLFRECACASILADAVLHSDALRERLTQAVEGKVAQTKQPNPTDRSIVDKKWRANFIRFC